MLLAFVIAFLLLFGGYGAVHLRLEERQLRRAIDREVALLGRSVQLSIDNALRDRQLEDIQATLNELEAIDPTVDIVVYDAAGGLGPRSEGAPASEPARDELMAHILSSGRTERRFHPRQAPTHMLAGFPLPSPEGGMRGAVVLVRPLDDMHQDLTTTRQNILVVVLLSVVMTTVIGSLLSNFYLRRPLGRIVGAMQQVRGDTLSADLTVERDDEVGAVAREFKVMLENLTDARERLVREAEARVRLERGLRQVDKMVTIGQLAAGLAHEIGSPLQVLNGRARALASRAHDPDETRRNAEILAEQSERISRIVEHLLHFGRRRTPTLTSFDIVATLRRVTDFVAHEGTRRQVVITLEAEAEPLMVEADADQIQQVALNLLTNALAATPAGGRIRVEVAKSRMHTDSGSEAPSVRLVFTDTGCGIPEAVQPSLFEPFFTTRAAEGGTGLGLAVVKGIVAEHGGTLAVTTERDHGTCFTIHLPLDRRGKVIS